MTEKQWTRSVDRVIFVMFGLGGLFAAWVLYG